MEISAEYAEAMFNKGMVIWVYDDSDDMFYDAEKTKPVETKWCKNYYDDVVQVENWYEILDCYEERGESITRFEIATTTGISKYWRNK